MKRLLLLGFLLLLVRSAASAADKDMVNLQRDVALVDDRVRMLQQVMDQRFAAVMGLLQETLDRVDRARTSNAALQTTLAGNVQRQQQQIEAPIQSMDTKLTRMSTDLAATRDSGAGIAGRLKHMEAKLTEMEALLRIIQAPSPPPPVSETSGAIPAGVTAEGLLQSAARDQMDGRYDQALQEYGEYLRYFGNTEAVASARLHMGEISLSSGKPAEAIEAFEAVAQEFPQSHAAPEAIHLKAQALAKAGKRSAAVRETSRLIRLYPDSDTARRAKAESAAKKTRRLP